MAVHVLAFLLLMFAAVSCRSDPCQLSNPFCNPSITINADIVDQHKFSCEDKINNQNLLQECVKRLETIKPLQVSEETMNCLGVMQYAVGFNNNSTGQQCLSMLRSMMLNGNGSRLSMIECLGVLKGALTSSSHLKTFPKQQLLLEQKCLKLFQEDPTKNANYTEIEKCLGVFMATSGSTFNTLKVNIEVTSPKKVTFNPECDNILRVSPNSSMVWKECISNAESLVQSILPKTINNVFTYIYRSRRSLQNLIQHTIEKSIPKVKAACINKTLEEKPSTEEILETEKFSIDEISETETPSTDEISGTEKPSTDEISETQKPSTVEISKIETPSTDEITETDKPSSNEISETEKPSTDEILETVSSTITWNISLCNTSEILSMPIELLEKPCLNNTQDLSLDFCGTELETNIIVLVSETPLKCKGNYSTKDLATPPTVVYTGMTYLNAVTWTKTSSRGLSFTCYSDGPSYTIILMASASGKDFLTWMTRDVKACDLLNTRRDPFKDVKGGEYELPEYSVNSKMHRMVLYLYRNDNNTNLSLVTIPKRYPFSIHEFAAEHDLCGPVAITEFFLADLREGPLKDNMIVKTAVTQTPTEIITVEPETVIKTQKKMVLKPRYEQPPSYVPNIRKPVKNIQVQVLPIWGIKKKPIQLLPIWGKKNKPIQLLPIWGRKKRNKAN